MQFIFMKKGRITGGWRGDLWILSSLESGNNPSLEGLTEPGAQQKELGMIELKMLVVGF